MFLRAGPVSVCTVGLLGFLFGRGVRPAVDRACTFIQWRGNYLRECRGESFHTAEILSAARPHLTRDEPNDEGGRSYEAFGVRVMLIPEPNNPHDANALRVARSNGRPLAYLARELAVDYHPEIARRAPPVYCYATVRGFSTRDTPLHLGIWLDLPTARGIAAACS